MTNWIADSKGKQKQKSYIMFSFVVRCILQNVGSNPGHYSCSECTIEGFYDSSKHCFCYPPDIISERCVLRTTESHITGISSFCTTAMMYNTQVGKIIYLTINKNKEVGL